MVTTKENPMIITQKNMIKKSKYTDNKRHQNTQRQQDKKYGIMNLQTPKSNKQQQ